MKARDGEGKLPAEAGQAPLQQWRLPGSSSSYQGTSAAVAMGMLRFTGARARGMERERGLISPPLLPTAVIVRYKNTIQCCALNTLCARLEESRQTS